MSRQGTPHRIPASGIRITITDGKSHAVDSSDNAFQAAARGAFREVYPRARPIILEPVMKLEVEGPAEFQGALLKTVMQRRGTIIGTTEGRWRILPHRGGGASR